ncbi:MAG: hypothetical protein OEW77_00925, partial [Gemmatimonadota bacterium]|nr:hypothetical protein [Gemmatimonadota bacterium]
MTGPRVLACLLAACALSSSTARAQPRFTVTFPAERSTAPLDGRLLVYISTDTAGDPRLQVSDNVATAQVFGVDVDGWRAGAPQMVDANAFGYPLESLRALKPGRYRVQAMLNRYQTFRRSDGHTVKLPPDRGEGQQMTQKPGNLHSRAATVTIAANSVVRLALDQEIPPVEDFAKQETKYVKYVRIRSERLSAFWGTDMYLGAWVLLPEGFDSHPDARYPLVINHGHFPSGVGGWRETPPDPDLKPDYSARFSLAGYNRIQQELAYQFYQDWTGQGFPRMLLIEIQHP